MTTLRANEPLPDGAYDVAHYRRVHRHLFQDVYAWAGKYRTVRTSKGGNPFCFPENIAPQMERLFARLQQSQCLNAESSAQFVATAAEFLAELNAIHPFREGNGRAQLAFVHLLGQKASFALDFSRVRRETFMPAMIASYHGDLKPLIAELTDLLA
jgi:cell filamentation protein